MGMIFTRQDGICIEVQRPIERLKANWSLWECLYQLPGKPDWNDGFIQGDGHMWAEETLEDEGGSRVALLPHEAEFREGGA